MFTSKIKTIKNNGGYKVPWYKRINWVIFSEWDLMLIITLTIAFFLCIIIATVWYLIKRYGI